MGSPAAKQGDRIVGVDTHIVMIPSPGGPVPTPLPSPFVGELGDELSDDVNIQGKPAATEGSKASNSPSHIPAGGNFQNQPADEGEVMMGSSSVFINGKAVARMGDTANTCNDPADAPVGSVIAVSTVLVGG